MKALRWIIILVNGLKVDGSEEIGFVGKLIEEKNPDINFEDLSYISHYELNNKDNIFNVEVVSGILTTTIPAPDNAIENEENALTFVEDYYSLLLENKEYEIAFDSFSMEHVKGFLLYLSPHEPSLTTRNMVQQVKGGQKTKLPSIERNQSQNQNQAEITSRIQQENLGSVTHEIKLESDSYEAQVEMASEAGEHEDWNSFVQGISPQDADLNKNVVEKLPEPDISTSPNNRETQKVDIEHAEWNSFIENVSPNTEVLEPQNVEPPVIPKEENSEWDSFVQDVIPQNPATQNPTTESFTNSSTQKVDVKHVDWESFMESEEVPQKTETMTTPLNVKAERSHTVYKNPPTKRLKIPPITEENKGEWNEFLGELGEQKDKIKETPEKLKESEIFPGKMQQTDHKKTFSLKNKTSYYQKESISPTPVPFKNRDANATKVYVGNTENTPPKKTARFAIPPQKKEVVEAHVEKTPDVTFEDLPKVTKPSKKKVKKQKKLRRKKSFFRKFVTFIFLLVLISGGGFAYLWFEHPVIAQEIISQSQKYIAIIVDKINQKPKETKNMAQMVEDFKTTLKPNALVENILKIATFEKENGISSELIIIKSQYTKKFESNVKKEVARSVYHLGDTFKRAIATLEESKKLSKISPKFANIYQNAQKAFSRNKKTSINRSVQTAQEMALDNKWKSALKIFEQRKLLFSKEHSGKTVEQFKQNIVRAFVDKHINKSPKKGIDSLRKFLAIKGVNHNLVKTENAILYLLYNGKNQVKDLLKKKQYNIARKKVKFYSRISKYIKGNLIQWHKEIYLEELFWKEFYRGFKKLKIDDTLEYNDPDDEKTRKLTIVSKAFAQSYHIINGTKKIDIVSLTIPSLKKVIEKGSKDTDGKIYYKIGLFLFNHKNPKASVEAFEKSKNPGWRHRSKLVKF